ncbi:MAG: DUF6232 family protein [Sulfurospirillaceae bacterium]|nr:DUF6232 family protein [Sulfurospirillaceae bacterium]
MIEITKKYIKVDETVYFRNNIKNIDFIENKNNAKEKIGTFIFEFVLASHLFLILIIPVIFYKNFFTIILAIIGVIGALRPFIFNKQKYEIYIGFKRIYSSDNEKEFREIKEKILEVKE